MSAGSTRHRISSDHPHSLQFRRHRGGVGRLSSRASASVHAEKSGASGAPISSLALRTGQVLQERDIVRHGDKVVVCVSGGVDSVALLHLMVELREEWALDLHVLHFNHGKRAESEEEEAFVKDLGARLGVETHVRHPAKAFESVGFQAKARAWRRDEAEQLLDAVAGRVILQGHHADDQTETILMKLMRGCHVSNIAGMSHRTGKYGRPLLDVPKDELRAYLTARSLEWREDASNSDTAFLRNRVRAELVPLLRDLTDGDLRSQLEDITDQSASFRRWLDTQPSCVVDVGSSAVDLAHGEVDVEAWSSLPELAQEDQLFEYVRRSTGVSVRYHNLRKVCRQMRGDSPAWDWRLSKEWNLVRVGARVWTQRKMGADKGEDEPSVPSTGESMERVVVEPRGVVVSHPKGWSVRCFWEDSVAVNAESSGPGVVLANLPERCELSLRTRRPGDRFCPPTRTTSVKLKDWMRANDFPLHTRDRTPLVCVGAEVLAVYPGAVASAATPGGSTCGSVLRVVVDSVTL